MTRTTTATPDPIPDEIARREQDLTDRVVRSFDGAPDERFRQVMQALVRHLHAFVREVRLTPDEWEAAVRFLTACGHITTDKRQEFILLSDVLGLSMQTITVNDTTDTRATAATVLGPFFVEGTPRIEIGGDIANGASGRPCWVEGQVRDTAGDPVPHARIEVWEADADGYYDVQYGDDRTAGRAHLFSDEQGRYAFWGVRPVPYPIPHDGPVGRLLEAAGRGPMRPAHLHFMVDAPGYRRLITHIFVRGCEYLDKDAVFGVRDSLIVDFVEQTPQTPTPDGRQVDGPWDRVRFDLVLAPEDATATAEK